jgi:flagellin-like protein
MLTAMLIALLTIFVLGAVPTWPYSRGWGYYPSGVLGTVLLVIIVLILAGRL